MIITITGDLGSGKSTVAKVLAKELNYSFFSTGDAFRELGASKGLDVLELSELAKTDESIDKYLDDQLINFKDDNYVVDSRLAWHFIKNSFKIYLKAEKSIAAERILNANRESEKYKTKEEAIQSIIIRSEEECERYKSRYNVNLRDFSNYDLVLDSSYIRIEEIVDIIMKTIMELGV
jgi:cytidylate kinase